MKGALAVVIVGLAALMTGCGGETPAADSEPPPIVSVENRDRSELDTTIVGATKAQERLLREILDSVDPDHVDKVVVEPVEAGWEPFPEGAVQVALSGRDSYEATWARILVAGAFMDRSADAGLPTVEVFGEHGAATTRAGGRSEAADPAPIDPRTLIRLARSVAEGADAADARVVDIRVLKPWGNAVAITLRVGDPAPFLAHRFEKYFDRESTTGDESFSDGALLQVMGPGNEVIYATASTERLTTYGTWIPLRLEGCFPTGMPRPSGYEIPPCPLEAG